MLWKIRFTSLWISRRFSIPRRPANDPVGRLDKQLESGKAKLDYAATNGWGYLPSLLKQLGVNIDSQVLVFSRTSIQTSRISPRTPRAIYFNDDVAVGYVQNGESLELTGLDPRQGIYLYTLDPAKSDKPRFGRRDDCLRCHQGPITFGVPGLMVSSVHPADRSARGPWQLLHDGSAHPVERALGRLVRDRNARLPTSSWKQYGAGRSASSRRAAREATQNVTSLAQMFDTSKYLAPTSDIVALMTLEHQTRMTNLIIAHRMGRAHRAPRWQVGRPADRTPRSMKW